MRSQSVPNSGQWGCTATRVYCRRERWPQGYDEVHYQLQVTLDTRTITEVEVLVRWGHPRRGLVMPSESIQVTEEPASSFPSGSGRWKLVALCRLSCAWGIATYLQPCALLTTPTTENSLSLVRL